MCLLIASPYAAMPIDLDYCRNATRGNPDGFGIAFPDASGQRVKILKVSYASPRKQLQLFRKLEKERRPFIAHWRYATHGAICRDLAHPFPLAEDSAIAHNGIMRIETIPGESDTSTLAQYLRTIGAVSPRKAIKAIAELGADAIGGSKFAAIDARGDIAFHNESAGIWQDGIWHSNESGMPLKWEWAEWESREIPPDFDFDNCYDCRVE